LLHNTGNISKSIVQQYRLGEREPSYAFIEALLTTNALHFDPTRIQSADGGRLAGEQRVALFTEAGLIEVTPESMREWNREVLAGYRRLIESDSHRPLPRWGDLMTKLLSFHMQGGRQSYEDIADHCNGNGTPIFPTFHRLNALFHNRRTPTEEERLALYRYAGLEDGQIASIEKEITTGTIPLGFARRTTPFAAALHSILDRLAGQGVTLTQLALRSARQHAPAAIPVSQTNLSAWRYGRELPTLASLRALTEVLRQFGPGQLTDPVMPAEIDGLLIASGFHPRDLTDTTHQIIARIDEQTRIKPLLRALQSAPDTCLPPKEVHRHGTELGYEMPSVDMLRKWEESGQTYPTGERVRNLLLIHNCLIRQNGFLPLSEEEIGKVVAVGERDYANWQSRSHVEKLAEQRKPLAGRRPPSPSFDSSEHGR